MSLIDALRHRLHVLWRGDAYTLDVLREMRFHRELGARRGDHFGNETRYLEETRGVTPLAWLDRIRQDVRYAARGLRRSPGFTTAVVLTLALGIGVNASMLSLLRRVFVNPPAGVVAPNDVRRLYLSTHDVDGVTVLPGIRYPQYAPMRATVDSSVRIGLFTPPDSTSIRDGASRLTIRVSRVNGDYFGVLGVRPAAGRFFDAAEGRPEEITPVVVLSDAYWRRVFGASPAVIGRRMTILNATFTVIGVAARDFSGPDIDATDAWVPMNTLGLASPIPWYQTPWPWFKMIVRPVNAAAESRMRRQSEAAIRRIRLPGYDYDSLINVVSGPIVEAAGPLERSAPVAIAVRVAGVALVVLIIVGANVMNMLLLRGSGRSREIAVRRALGVSRTRLAEQMIVESLVLALSAGAIAVVFSLWATIALRRLVLADVHWAGPPIDAMTIVAVAGVSVLIAFVTGLVSSSHAMRPALANALKSSGRDGKRTASTRTVLLIVQAALSLALVATSGLFLRSFDAVASIGIGYDTRDRIFVSPIFDEPPLNDARTRAAYAEATRRLSHFPGVMAIGSSMIPTPLRGGMYMSIFVPGRPTDLKLPGDIGESVSPISPGYLAASGMRLIQGRDFTDADNEHAPGVVLVGESMARLYWPDETAIGKCIRLLKPDAECYAVVGVVADVHRRGIIEATAAQWYVPIAQRRSTPGALVLHVARGSAAAIRREADRVFRELLPEVARVRILTFDDIVEPHLRPWRLGATLFTALGILALAVAAVGIYSVIAYAVSQRAHEMAVRVALGAQRRDVLDLVLRDGLRMISAGIVAGVAIALVAGRLVASLLFGVLPTDASVLLSAAVSIIAVGGVACLIPGWRAARADPVNALRAE